MYRIITRAHAHTHTHMRYNRAKQPTVDRSFILFRDFWSVLLIPYVCVLFLFQLKKNRLEYRRQTGLLQ